MNHCLTMYHSVSSDHPENLDPRCLSKLSQKVVCHFVDLIIALWLSSKSHLILPQKILVSHKNSVYFYQLYIRWRNASKAKKICSPHYKLLHGTARRKRAKVYKLGTPEQLVDLLYQSWVWFHSMKEVKFITFLKVLFLFLYVSSIYFLDCERNGENFVKRQQYCGNTQPSLTGRTNHYSLNELRAFLKHKSYCFFFIILLFIYDLWIQWDFLYLSFRFLTSNTVKVTILSCQCYTKLYACLSAYYGYYH